MVNLKIDNFEVDVPAGTSILEAARKVQIDIPTLCKHPDVDPTAGCGMCIVKVNGRIMRSCCTPVAEGMEVITGDAEIMDVRRTVLELILSNHPNECLTCIRSGHCELQDMANSFGIQHSNLPSLNKKYDKDDSTKAIVLDASKCIVCGRCVEVCQNQQNVWALSYLNRGLATRITAAGGIPLADSPCIKCGQCITHCPVGAIYEQDDVSLMMKAISDPDKIVAVQMAPSVRVAVGEEFGMEPGEITTGKLYTALRRLGIDYVFDTNFGADLTIMEEASELVERIKDGGVLPQFTSCCPGWVNYVEEYYPELLDNLSSAKSPMMMQGAITKTYWADKIGVDPSKIYSVAIMPCTAKKDEIRRPMNASEYKDVDVVLTTRELGRIISQYGIDFKNLEDSEADSPIGEYTGAATIFGVTGGVMEAAVRSAYKFVTGDELENVEVSPVRGMSEVKKGTVDFKGTPVRVAVVHGMANAKEILEEVKAAKLKGERAPYEFIEIMACRGGCIAGGGQPIGTDDEVRAKRTKGLYTDDERCTLRRSHENPSIIKLYDDFLGKPLSHKAHETLHTSYKPQKVYKDEV